MRTSKRLFLASSLLALATAIGHGQGLITVVPPGFEVEEFAVVSRPIGMHFDLKVNDRLTWRVVQPDVLVTNYGNDVQSHFRISSGLGFGF